MVGDLRTPTDESRSSRRAAARLRKFAKPPSVLGCGWFSPLIDLAATALPNIGQDLHDDVILIAKKSASLLCTVPDCLHRDLT